jgi:hypothetical protein
VILFCSICKRSVAIPEGLNDADAQRYFRSFGHDERIPPRGLRRGLVGAYARDFETEPTTTTVVLSDPDPDAADAPREISECFENSKPIDPERLAA